ncbi:MAG TPA: hypothetical protein VME21_07980 [Steroidobacteraceae bacterium]|nr:hypothetical protein [Steroidobacteraceae bacterium]
MSTTAPTLADASLRDAERARPVDVAAAPALAPSERYSARVQPLVFASLIICGGLLLHPYHGIRHDAILYSIQALGHLHPGLYAHDIFLRYGSQDRFTLFSPVYAALIGTLGLDHAALLLTLVAQGLLLAAAWQLARLLMPRRQAWLAVALLVVLPLSYGSLNIFHVLEEFVTPRPFAEALVLAGAALLIAGRQWAALLAMLLACSLHPIMGSAGIALLLLLRVFPARPRLCAAVACLGVLALTIAARGPLAHRLVIDSAWMSSVLLHARYLTLAHWTSLDCSRISGGIATLAVGAFTLAPGTARSLARAALATGVLGTLLSWWAGDVLQLILIVQAQPWRWMWLTMALGAVLLPLIGTELWYRGPLHRAVLALLVCAYLFQDEVYAMPVGGLAAAFALLATRLPSMPQRHARLILWGAASLLSCALLFELIERPLEVQALDLHLPGHPWLEFLMRASFDSSLPALLLAACWWCTFRGPRALRLAVGLCGLGGFLCLLPFAVERWMAPTFPPGTYAEYASWRERIPRGAEVLDAQSPLFTWVILERPNYISLEQTTSAVFSREAAMVIDRRLQALRTFLAGEGAWTHFATAAMNLDELCASTDVRYIVTHRALAARPLASMPAGMPAPLGNMKLYSCARGS